MKAGVKRRPAYWLWDPAHHALGQASTAVLPSGWALGLPIILKSGLGVVREGVSPAHLEKDRDVFL